MTLAMPDSIRVGDLPPGYPAYLGYADGDWPTAPLLAAKFPAAHRIILTVTGRTESADGCDCESGDLSPQGAADWTLHKLRFAPMSRPVVYASVSVMPDVIAELGTRGIKRAQVRLLSAHYGWTGGQAGRGLAYGEHICGPDSCRWPGVPPMDGTQWTSSYPGVSGAPIDMSLLADSFFGPVSWTERLVQELPVVREGDGGFAVMRVQALANIKGFQGAPLTVDGQFGWKTKGAIEIIQADAKVPVDGVVGPQTWPVLLGLTP